jgi:transcription elongation factor
LEVSRYYIDGRPLSHTLQARLPTQQLFKPPPSVESIQIGDSIDVLVGEHMGKSGIVRWLSKGGNYLWFQHESSNIPVPIKTVQRIPNLQTLQFTQDRGYDVKAGDVVKVARGPEYSTKGVVQSVDFPNARLTLLAETDHSLVSTDSSQTCAYLTLDRLTFPSDSLSK